MQNFLLTFSTQFLVNHTLEHLYSPAAAIKRSYEILRPGGMLLVTVPKFDSWPRDVCGKFWANLDLPRHLYHFTEPVLTEADRSGRLSGPRSQANFQTNHPVLHISNFESGWPTEAHLQTIRGNAQRCDAGASGETLNTRRPGGDYIEHRFRPMQYQRKFGKHFGRNAFSAGEIDDGCFQGWRDAAYQPLL